MYRTADRKGQRLILAALAITTMAAAQQYELSRFTIDGGGGLRSSSGAFELSGTIGQLDAGTMTGDRFQLNGGFWFALSPFDCNEDGSVNLFEYETFKTCLTGPLGPSTSGVCVCYDVDGSERVDLEDFSELQVRFSGE